MTKETLFRFALVCFLAINTAASGQKVKYKDIFALLSTKQFEQAEPFLKKYLQTNDDNPNAFLYMGMVFHEKSLKQDVLRQTKASLAYIDSAILFYDKAYATINEKEVRREKEYYQAYNRRDLRTGEFGIKVSDIQLDLEKRKQALKERADRLKMTKHYFSITDTSYKICNSNYTALQQQFPTEHQFYLRADESTLKSLTTLAVQFDSCLKAFDNYKATSSHLGQTGYKQTITLTEISDFKKDGSAATDFFGDELRLWDYKKFALKSKQIIEKEIIPTRSHLVTYDVEINKLREKLTQDSVSVRNDLTRLLDVLLYDQLKKYDNDPLPTDIFAMKTADLEYKSVLLENEIFRDSADVHLQLRLVSEEMDYLKKLDSLCEKLAKSDLEARAKDYDYFIKNTYSNTVVLDSYVKALKDFSGREKVKKETELTSALKAKEWMIEGNDSIPLNLSVTNKRFKPLLVDSEKYTVGLSYKDSLNADGYFYAITPSRKPSQKFTFPVDKPSFKETKFSNAKALSFGDPSGQLYYVLLYSEQDNQQKFPATLSKIYKTDGVAWTNNIALTFIPKQLTFKAETSELIIEDELANLLVVDKNRKVLK